ncbi:MAG: hypothetical protein A2X61_15510 [Ignavibacteria bacterium GWB2_35_12]|nr:MAG: hypothetical protein A2X63_09645 [Ignavibacteria bacterium GWA2_35_8]OGU38825.1 MAG: hypothetical protein A2X61_15510 [Ignavibacteria bacterium GWB2_35_12]OGU88544.1 MAG: hypothetical protein A2220_06275 [Ignavibacteria bacterium RIFOXYA2_FULL_35_10]OGV20309.1 MAG: hypothetical protein A2475_12295 [Ignavibacteria bacterium RIFOXYC2_FULL_35_21]
MPKNTIRLRHMLDAANKIMKFIKNRSRSDLDTDEMLILAILKLIEIIGEAASSVTFEIKEKHPEIPWRQIISVRNRLIHGYFDINHNILWEIVIKDLPPLIKNLEIMLTEIEN